MYIPGFNRKNFLQYVHTPQVGRLFVQELKK